MEINTRNQAADKGLLRYWDGKPCKRGHNSERYTRNGVREGKTAKEQAAAHARAMAQQAPRRSAAGLTPSRSYTNASVDGRRDPLTLEGSMVCVRAGGEDFLKHKSLGL